MVPTTLLTMKGPLDPHSRATLYTGGACYKPLEPRSYMLTISASFY